MKSTFALLGAIAAAVAPLAGAQPRDSTTADTSCVAGSRSCPFVARVLPGGHSSYVSGQTTKDSPRVFVAFEAQGSPVPGEPPGELYLTIDPITGSGMKWGAGVPISFPAGKGGDTVQPGKSFKLPGAGSYILEVAANTMADDAFGPFLVKLNVSTVARAAERPALCKLVVKGKTYIDGQCWFSPRGKGSFQIAANDHFAQVDVDGRAAEAHWNEDSKATHAHSRLGAVTRTGACWVNATTQICARDLPAGKLAAELSAQPKGDSIAAVVAGNICLMPKGMKWAEGVPLVVDNCPYGKSVSRFMRVGDAIRVDGTPELCVGVARGARTLELQKCAGVGVRWSYEAASLGGALARSNSGDCWTIPELDNEKAKWPLAVAALPCQDRKIKPQPFYF